ncbi:MAG: tetratricopeptide repeat protein [Cyanobacteria bacterium SZAS TMP-1]|nr:tetratricopeptide repeat protein [Cyanobacteria bacterium SZAS TMP-1]
MRVDNIELAELIYMADVYRKRRFFAEATALLTEALNAARNDDDLTTDAIVQYSLARVYEQQGNSFFARELDYQALRDWLGGKDPNPINQLWPFRSRRSLDRACEQLIQTVQERSDIRNLPLPRVPQSDSWLEAG